MLGRLREGRRRRGRERAPRTEPVDMNLRERARRRTRRLLYPITRWLPTAILWVTTPFSEASNPLRPKDLPLDIPDEEIIQILSEAGKAADDRARAAAPAAGLLGTIASLFHGNLEYRTELVIAAAATILAALFAQSARAEQIPGVGISEESREIAAYALRRKEAWARLASYFAFVLAVALIVFSITS